MQFSIHGGTWYGCGMRVWVWYEGMGRGLLMSLMGDPPVLGWGGGGGKVWLLEAKLLGVMCMACIVTIS